MREGVYIYMCIIGYLFLLLNRINILYGCISYIKYK